MIKVGKVSKHELELVNRLVHHCEPPEHLAKGVLLTTKMANEFGKLAHLRQI